MKKFFPVAMFLVIAASLSAQKATVSGPEKKIKYYTVSGFRHGTSYFPKTELKNVEYTAGDSLTFDRYHSEQVVLEWMRRWNEKYPDLVDLYEVGESYEGRKIWQMTFSNKKTGKDTDKPAAFFEGGRHSGEVTGTECVLYLAKYLLDNYGKDPEVTHLLDTKAIYLKPINNPDGHNLYLNTAQSNRSTVRPEDNDNDGLLDEDPPEDLNGDGMILTMRWKDEKKGNMIPDPKDPTGRIMKRVDSGKGIYLTASEGIDNDGDGKINEDGIGGLDLHRNYPENWRPESEATGRGYSQSGAGDFPLSENETKAVVMFLLSHPNVYVVNSMDTSVPMHLRPPSTSGSEERMFPEDLEFYKLFDKIGKEKTGYEKAGDVYNDYGDGNPLFGHGPDFGYWYFGAIWYGDEIWNSARFKDYNNDGEKDQLDQIKWDDEENDSIGFNDWKPAKHPVYGDIEIGGFDPKFFSQNPPAKHLMTWIKNEAMFNLEMTKHLPELAWGNIEVQKIKSWKTDSAEYHLKISFRNTGKLPTALKQAYLVKIVKEDQVVINLDTTGFSKDKILYRQIEEKKNVNRNSRNRYDDDERKPQTTFIKTAGFTNGGKETTATFVIRLYGITELKGKAVVKSTRGGILPEKDFVIK
ncbi:MAG TPA: M14 family metallopeptidase [Bacteroidales bacterium]|nr:M14 family metallopeptidase [Bacteroidales bacterium]